MPENQLINESMLINEIQLLLAEKRTSLSTMRTGIAVFALPLTVLSFLIVTSSFYKPADVATLLVVVFLLCAGLLGLGAYLMIRSFFRIHHYDRQIAAIKSRSELIAQIVD
jgi:uncharacterized membrane protein YkgB